MSDAARMPMSIDPQVAEKLRHSWGWFVFFGLALVVLGVVALGASVVATLVSVVFIGWLMIFAGVLQLVNAFRMRSSWKGFIRQLVMGVLGLLVGLVLIANPAAGAVSITLVLAAFFVVGGIVRIFSALTHQFPQRGWTLVSGILALVLGLMIWSEWPFSGLWVIGTFVGIDMLFDGWSLVALGMAARRP